MEEQYETWIIVQRPAKRNNQKGKASKVQNSQEESQRGKHTTPNKDAEKKGRDNNQEQSKAKKVTGSRFDVLDQNKDTVKFGEMDVVNETVDMQEDGANFSKACIQEKPVEGSMDGDPTFLSANKPVSGVMVLHGAMGKEDISQDIPTVNLGEDFSYLGNNNSKDGQQEADLVLSHSTVRLESPRIPSFKGRKDLSTVKINSPLNLGVKNFSPRQTPFKENNISGKGRIDIRKQTTSSPNPNISRGKENLGLSILSTPGVFLQERPRSEQSAETPICHHESTLSTSYSGNSHSPGVYNIHGVPNGGTNNGDSTSIASQGGNQCEILPAPDAYAQSHDGVSETTNGASSPDECFERGVHEFTA